MVRNLSKCQAAESRLGVPEFQYWPISFAFCGIAAAPVDLHPVFLSHFLLVNDVSKLPNLAVLFKAIKQDSCIILGLKPTDLQGLVPLLRVPEK